MARDKENPSGRFTMSPFKMLMFAEVFTIVITYIGEKLGDFWLPHVGVKYRAITLRGASLPMSDIDEFIESSKYIPLYMFGAFIIISCGMFSGFLFMTSRGREIAAFSAQQAVPVGKEIIDEMAPSSGKVAKEIAKGIKEALDEDEE